MGPDSMMEESAGNWYGEWDRQCIQICKDEREKEER